MDYNIGEEKRSFVNKGTMLGQDYLDYGVDGIFSNHKYMIPAARRIWNLVISQGMGAEVYNQNKDTEDETLLILLAIFDIVSDFINLLGHGLVEKELNWDSLSLNLRNNNLEDYTNEIKNKRKIITKLIYNQFESDSIKIMEFISGDCQKDTRNAIEQDCIGIVFSELIHSCERNKLRLLLPTFLWVKQGMDTSFKLE